uniref:Uncharacterized protein n=1 Tax=Timema cristinae TaxID=61476 RepID=A0A7R9D2S2_TIMCR|nr:unnamed protein product [Timema cristinae]
MFVYSWYQSGTFCRLGAWYHPGTPLLAHSLDRACMPRSLLDCTRLECMGLEAGHLPCLQSLRPDIEGIIRYVDCCPREYGAERSLHNPSTMNAERVGRRHCSDKSVVVAIMLSFRYRVQQGHKITWNLTITDIGAGTDTDIIGTILLQEKREQVNDNKYSPHFPILAALYSEPRQTKTLPTAIPPHRQMTSSA